MQKRFTFTSIFLCIVLVLAGGCTGTGNPATPPSSTPAPFGGTPGQTAGWAEQVFPCSIGAPIDTAKASVLEIKSVEGQGDINDVFYIRGKVLNKGGESTYAGLAGKSCDTTTGACDGDNTVAVILQPHETGDFTLVTRGGCPATGTAATCTCEVWLDIST